MGWLGAASRAALSGRLKARAVFAAGRGTLEVRRDRTVRRTGPCLTRSGVWCRRELELERRRTSWGGLACGLVLEGED